MFKNKYTQVNKRNKTMYTIQRGMLLYEERGRLGNEFFIIFP